MVTLQESEKAYVNRDFHSMFFHSLPTRRTEDIRDVLNRRQGRRKVHYIINIHPNLVI
jgi:hypothetical protein